MRIILNLNKLNSFVAHHHFKRETIQHILHMSTPNCWMASVDLKYAYYSVKVHPGFQRYLKFKFQGNLYAYTVYPIGLASCPRQFTKLLKPPISLLRSRGHIISSYIDDIYIFKAARTMAALIPCSPHSKNLTALDLLYIRRNPNLYQSNEYNI